MKSCYFLLLAVALLIGSCSCDFNSNPEIDPPPSDRKNSTITVIQPQLENLIRQILKLVIRSLSVPVAVNNHRKALATTKGINNQGTTDRFHNNQTICDCNENKHFIKPLLRDPSTEYEIKSSVDDVLHLTKAPVDSEDNRDAHAAISPNTYISPDTYGHESNGDGEQFNSTYESQDYNKDHSFQNTDTFKKFDSHNDHGHDHANDRHYHQSHSESLPRARFLHVRPWYPMHYTKVDSAPTNLRINYPHGSKDHLLKVEPQQTLFEVHPEQIEIPEDQNLRTKPVQTSIKDHPVHAGLASVVTVHPAHVDLSHNSKDHQFYFDSTNPSLSYPTHKDHSHDNARPYYYFEDRHLNVDPQQTFFEVHPEQIEIPEDQNLRTKPVQTSIKDHPVHAGLTSVVTVHPAHAVLSHNSKDHQFYFDSTNPTQSYPTHKDHSHDNARPYYYFMDHQLNVDPQQTLFEVHPVQINYTPEISKDNNLHVKPMHMSIKDHPVLTDFTNSVPLHPVHADLSHDIVQNRNLNAGPLHLAFKNHLVDPNRTQDTTHASFKGNDQPKTNSQKHGVDHLHNIDTHHAIKNHPMHYHHHLNSHKLHHEHTVVPAKNHNLRKDHSDDSNRVPIRLLNDHSQNLPKDQNVHNNHSHNNDLHFRIGDLNRQSLPAETVHTSFKDLQVDNTGSNNSVKINK